MSHRMRGVVASTSTAVIFAAALAIVVSSAGFSPADEAQSDGDAKPNAARLEQMQERAKLATIGFVDGDRDRTIDLHPLPLLRYSDSPRGFRDGVVFEEERTAMSGAAQLR